MFTFNPKDYDTSHDEICRYNTFNRRITNARRGWGKNETVFFRENTMKLSFFSLFQNIGEIQQLKLNKPAPTKLR